MKIFLSDSLRGRVAETLMYLTLIGYFTLYFLLQPQVVLDLAAPMLFAIFFLTFRTLMARWKSRLYEDNRKIRHIFMYFMTWKLGKMLASAVLIVCYMKLCGEQLRAFLISFALFYLIQMWVEIAAWREVEHKIKANGET
ncbi:MAG: hypothetical protein LBT94_07145 [Prevotellaceae bacterium]|nr:hypothetical protein [Prevotellaceae bacterium]